MRLVPRPSTTGRPTGRDGRPQAGGRLRGERLPTGRGHERRVRGRYCCGRAGSKSTRERSLSRRTSGSRWTGVMHRGDRCVQLSPGRSGCGRSGRNRRATSRNDFVSFTPTCQGCLSGQEVNVELCVHARTPGAVERVWRATVVTVFDDAHPFVSIRMHPARPFITKISDLDANLALEACSGPGAVHRRASRSRRCRVWPGKQVQAEVCPPSACPFTALPSPRQPSDQTPGGAAARPGIRAPYPG